MQDKSSAQKSMEVLLTRVESLDQLEVLLVLAEAPERPHTAGELLERASVRPEDLLEVMAQLVSRGMVLPLEDGSWRLSEDAQSVEGALELLSAYRKNPTPIVRSIVQGAIERARDITGWASAFLFRGE